MAALIALAWHHDPPSGVLLMTAAWPSSHPYVSELKPVARAVTTETPVSLTGGPVYFDVMPPTPYETVTVEAVIKPQDAAAVRIGAMATADGRFDVSAAYVRPIATLDWPTVASGDLVLQQRERAFASVDDFMASAPTGSALTYPAGAAAGAPSSNASGASMTYAVSARGAHRLYARVPNGESLRLRLLVQDMNRQAGADSARLTVFRAGSNEPMKTVSLEDDGDIAPDWKAQTPRELSVDWRPEAAGEYWLTFDGSDDLFIRQMTTPLREFGFLGRAYLGDEVGYDDDSAPATVLVTGRRLQARAMNTEAMQTISVAGHGMMLPAVGEKVERNLEGASLVVVPHRGVVLTTDGRLTLNATVSAASGNLDPRDDEDALGQAGIEYILSRTGDVSQHGLGAGEYRLRATFRTDELALTPSGAYRFVIDVTPGDSGRPALLSSVRLAWQREPIPVATWLRRIFTRDELPVSGAEPPRSGLEDFDEQIP